MQEIDARSRYPMDRGRINHVVMHPPSWDPGSHALAVEAATRHPDRFSILGHVAPGDPDRLEKLDAMMDEPGVCGLQYTFLQAEEKTWLNDGHLDWLGPIAEARQIPVALLAAGYLHHVARSAAQHPVLKLIADHLGVRRGNLDAAAFASFPDVVALAAFPNVAVKMTGGLQYVSDGFPFASLQSRYQVLYEAFGSRRVFWGTDITRMPCSWHECVLVFVDHQPWLPPEDLPWLMGRGIAQWIGWAREDWS